MGEVFFGVGFPGEWHAVLHLGLLRFDGVVLPCHLHRELMAHLFGIGVLRRVITVVTTHVGSNYPW
ncbi:MAG: hypothetical protein CM1200mP41_38440 [Gammaproteobacteria bacterium]|nr:MAG: hypothetical protein CM1200mP41_38440 [Gammaproteobacteria bacterium]